MQVWPGKLEHRFELPLAGANNWGRRFTIIKKKILKKSTIKKQVDVANMYTNLL